MYATVAYRQPDGSFGPSRPLPGCMAEEEDEEAVISALSKIFARKLLERNAQQRSQADAPSGEP